MPKSTDAAKAWLEDLKKTGSLSEDEVKAIEATFSKPQVQEYLGSSVLRQQDYNRSMNQLKSDYDAEIQKVRDYEAELAKWQGGINNTTAHIKAELAQAKAEADRLRTVAASYGISNDDLGTPAPLPTPTPGQGRATEAPALDPKQFLARTEFEELGAMYTMLPAEINDIVAEHVELFGKQPKGMRQIVERAIKERRSIRDVYEEEFSVADKRRELEEKRTEAEIQRRVEEQLTAWRSQNPDVRVPRAASQRSFVLQKDNVPLPEDTSFASDQQSSVAAAVAHWSSMDHSDNF